MTQRKINQNLNASVTLYSEVMRCLNKHCLHDDCHFVFVAVQFCVGAVLFYILSDVFFKTLKWWLKRFFFHLVCIKSGSSPMLNNDISNILSKYFLSMSLCHKTMDQNIYHF